MRDRLGQYAGSERGDLTGATGCRRLHRRYERKAEHFLTFAGIAAALICYRRLDGATDSHGAEKARINAVELSA
ncbi:hypothetical protein S1361_37620 [Streptomyces cyanogenus]|uniref:Transposase n=1 Tax=Streptomyces cyanogenus TaxID=80860 RepID=A0ABX7U248_STRCY|nr:hypothetical protein S1361_37620 [Streptomyces cyanogenus]